MTQFSGYDIVEIAMNLELNGKAYYTAVAAKAQDPDVKALFEELAEQEQAHYEVFKSLLGNVVDEGPAGGAFDEAGIYIHALLQDTFFRGDQVALAQAEQARDDKDALGMAIGFEKETLLYYYELRDQVLESQRGLIDRVIAQEKLHIQRLAKLI